MMLRMVLVALMVEVNEVFDGSVCELLILQAGVRVPRCGARRRHLAEKEALFLRWLARQVP